MANIRARSGYMMKDDAIKKLREKYKLEYIANKVGISFSYISMITNKRIHCSKMVAYAITKTIDSEAEVDELFDRI